MAREPPRPPRAGESLRAVTSDVWYTLVYLRPRDQETLADARRKVWADPLVRAGLSRSAAVRTATETEAWAARAEARGRTPTLREQARRVARSTGVRLSAEGIGRRLDATLNAAPVRVAPGAARALDRLAGDGVRLGIVSNVLHETPDGLRGLLDRLGLRGFFPVMILSSEHRWAKPRPEPFRLALRGLRVAPAEAVHVGDLQYDVRGAQRAGVGALLYTGLHSVEPAGLVHLARAVDPTVPRLDRWTDLPPWLARAPGDRVGGRVPRTEATTSGSPAGRAVAGGAPPPVVRRRRPRTP